MIQQPTTRKQIERADVLVSAIGQAQFVRGEWIKQNAIVIDVGTNSVAGNIVDDDHNHEIVAIVYTFIIVLLV
jgi:5,10-methylene-tetrahydrofolate dehydrogenase/methenyl tetrahydrofolate cyclohydrolase